MTTEARLTWGLYVLVALLTAAALMLAAEHGAAWGMIAALPGLAVLAWAIRLRSPLPVAVEPPPTIAEATPASAPTVDAPPAIPSTEFIPPLPSGGVLSPLAEQALRAAPIGIAVLEPEGTILLANEALCRVLGTADPIGQDFIELVRQEDRAALSARLAAGGSGDRPAAGLEVRLSGPPEKVAQVYLSPMDARAGGGVLLHLVDMTEQKQLEGRVAQGQKMQAVGQLAGGVAHDFNNLLTAMIGFCDLLLLRHPPGDQSFADVMQIKQNASRAANLVRQLLAFSRQQTLRPRVLDLTDVLADLRNLISRLIGETIELKMIHGRDLGLVKVDQGQFEQVVINLAVNARDAMAQGGVLTIRTANLTLKHALALSPEPVPPGDWVVVEVTDTGKGIEPELFAKIFEPFFTTKEVGAGTGLGLSTCYGIIKQTGGVIGVESAPGQGAIFRIYLPRHRPGAAEPAGGKEETKRDARDLTGRGTILLVEDEDAVRTFAARALRNKGYAVIEANAGEAALKFALDKDQVIDMLISDVVMPAMDGPTLARRILAERPGLRVILISGYAEEAFRKGEDPGFTFHFLPKPFSLADLAAKVKDVMAD